MSNLITRSITGILFVTALVVCFLNAMAMALLFALITALSVWEFTGLSTIISRQASTALYALWQVFISSCL